MIYIVCKTSLDINETWPNRLPSVPRVGDRIRSAIHHKNDFQLELEVKTVTWIRTIMELSNGQYEWFPEIQLGIPQGHISIKGFFDWYAPLIGENPSTFY